MTPTTRAGRPVESAVTEDCGPDDGRAGGPGDPPPTAVGLTPGRRHDLRLLLPATAAWGMAWWAVAAPLPIVRAGFFLLAGLATVGGTWTMLRRRRSAHRTTVSSSAPTVLLLVAIVAALVLGVTLAQRTVRESDPLRGWIRDEAVITVSGRLRTDPHRLMATSYARSERYVLTIISRSVQGRGIRLRSSVPLLVLGGTGWAQVHAGQNVLLVGRLTSTDPGDDVVALLAAHGPPQQLQEGAWWWTAADRLRSGLRDATVGLPSEAGALLPSLVVGDVSRLSDDLVEDLRISGLSHLTAVSGANVAIVVGTVLLLSAWGGAGRRLRALLGGGAVVGFVILARPEPSVLRAAAMASVALIGLATRRRPQGGPALATAVILLLAVDPWLARSAGFALSVSATGGLLWLAPVWAGRLQRWMPRPVALAIAVPAAAQAACGPILVLVNPSLSTVSVPANLLAGPAVAPATVLGVLVAVLSVLSPSAASILAVPAGAATGWIVGVAHRAADIPGASLPWIAGAPGAGLLLAATVLVVLASSSRRFPRATAGVGASDGLGSRPPFLKRSHLERSGDTVDRAVPSRNPAARQWLVSVVVGALAFCLGWWWAPSLIHPGRGVAADWAVAQCDVGQGDAMVLRSGPEAGVLVDVGPDPEAVDACLRDLGVTELHLILLTHAHADHVAGLSGALRGRSVTEVLVDPLGLPEGETRQVRRQLADRHLDPRIGRSGTTGFAGAGGWSVRWRVLSAGLPTEEIPLARSQQHAGACAEAGTEDPRDGEIDDTRINDASIATVMEVRTPTGPVHVLALADVERRGQGELVELLREQPALLGGTIDVVKVAHHGSRSQDSELYRMSGASVAFISCGQGNDYGHPSKDTLALLADLGITVLRTDQNGLITIVARVEGLRLLTER